MSEAVERLFDFWEMFEIFSNLPEVEMLNEKGEKASASLINKRLKTGKNEIYREPNMAWKKRYNSANIIKEKQFFFCQSQLGVTKKDKIIEKIIKKLGITIQKNTEEYDHIENDWLYLFSVVANSENMIIGIPQDGASDNEDNVEKTEASYLAVKIKPFWFYLSKFLNNEKKQLSAKYIMNDIQEFNERFTEKFGSYYNDYNYWIIDTSFVIKLAGFWKSEKNPFLFYIEKRNEKGNHNLKVVVYDGVIKELDTLKDMGGKGEPEEIENRKKYARRGLGWIEELQEKCEKNVETIYYTHRLFDDDRSKVEFDGFHRKLKPESKIDDVDKAVIRISKYAINKFSPDQVILLTTDTTMKLWASELGIFSTGLLPHVYERKQKGLSEDIAKEMITFSLQWLKLDDLLGLTADDFEYPIVSSGKIIDKKYLFSEVDRYINEPPSFFISELELAKNNFGKNITLKHYIKGNPKSRKLNKDTERMILSPENIPPARWLSESWAKPFFNQALALSEVYRKFLRQDESGIASVNGPPGTGKTTILRDIIANIVTHRAYYLAKDIIDGRKILEKSDSAFGKIYRFSNRRLCDYNVVVASSNNNAVENISKELPLIDKVAEYKDKLADEPILAYFADCMQDSEKGARYWSPISVALGKKENLNKVKRNYIKKLGLMLKYLGKTEYEFKSKSEKEKKEAREKSEKLKALINSINLKQYAEDFLKLHNEIESIKRLIPFDKLIESESYSLKDYYESENRQFEIVSDEYMKLKDKANLLRSELHEISKRARKKTIDIENYKQSNRFSLRLSKIPILKSLTFVKKTLEEIQQLEEQASSLTKQKRQFENEAEELKDRLSFNEDMFYSKKQIKNQAARLFKSLRIDNLDDRESDILSVPNAIYNYPDKEKQLFTPYAQENFEQKRKELFFKALKLHYAFVLKNREKIKDNIDHFFAVLSNENGVFKKVKESGVGVVSDFWTAFSFVTPVISTTFHSVTNMFAVLDKPNTIGFAIIDEAGQGIPYYAAGLLMRAVRAIVVGDPLQIEPVVKMPASLRDALAKGLNAKEIANGLDLQNEGMIVPGMEHAIQVSGRGYIDTSVQVLADRASSVQSVIKRDNYEIPIGMPLRIHFRCKEPAFGIANAIAYSNTMIHGKKTETKGKGIYVNVDTNNTGWLSKNISADEIKMARKFLEKYKNRLSDVYVISPFVGIKDSKVRKELMNIENIGTIHTFQGKENKIVIIILGGATDGAIKWATRKPNLLNVAITRSQEQVIVIGNKNRWSENGGEMANQIFTLLDYQPFPQDLFLQGEEEVNLMRGSLQKI